MCVSMVSCRAPSLPKMVIFTPSRSLAFAPLKSVDLDASTVKIFRTPSPFENVRWLDCRSTSTGADGGAFLRSICRAQPRFKYTPTVSPTNTSATAALHRAYLAASLFLIAECHLPGDIASVNQNCRTMYISPAPSAVVASLVSDRLGYRRSLKDHCHDQP